MSTEKQRQGAPISKLSAPMAIRGESPWGLRKADGTLSLQLPKDWSLDLLGS